MEPLDVEEKTHKETAEKGICIENIDPEKKGIIFPFSFSLQLIHSNRIKLNFWFSSLQIMALVV